MSDAGLLLDNERDVPEQWVPLDDRDVIVPPRRRAGSVH